MCDQKKAVSRGSLLAVVINQAVEAKSCQRRRCNELSILSAGWSLWWHPRTWGKDLETTAKVGPQTRHPWKCHPVVTKEAEGEKTWHRDHGGQLGTSAWLSILSPSWHMGKLYCASHERPAQPLTWELASGGTYPRRELNRQRQRDPSQQGVEPSSSYVNLRSSTARNDGLT